MSEKESYGEGERLTTKQQKLIAGLLTGITIARAAQEAGIAEATAHRWLKLDYFKQAYKEAQGLLYDESIGQLRLGVKVAMAVLRKHAAADVEPTAATQIRAAQIWLEQAMTQRQVAELEQRLTELEQRLASGG